MRLFDQYNAIAGDVTLFDERNFARRFEAIELVEIASLEGVVPEARDLMAALEAVDARLFARLRAEIAVGRHRGKAFWELLAEYCGGEGDGARGLGRMDQWWHADDESGYDTLDVFINRLCSYLPMPLPVRPLEPEMVEFHKTPARVVLELARRVMAEDVFVDLGAGLGQVALLVHLLTGARTRGLEIEPAFCEYARQCAAGLGVDVAGHSGSRGVAFVEGDARFARYEEGAFFFLYTPFTGEVLKEVLGLLQTAAAHRKIKLASFGPCTAQIGLQNWLTPAPMQAGQGNDGLRIFSSI